jgi:hypothetical protein
MKRRWKVGTQYRRTRGVGVASGPRASMVPFRVVHAEAALNASMSKLANP